jgi:SAM-dependent methyltransferase
LITLRRWLKGESAPPDKPPARLRGEAQLAPRLILRIERLRERGEAPRLLIAGMPGGSMIEGFSRMGVRVTVDGDELPVLPLGHADATFDMIFGADTLDQLADEPARSLGGEWARVLRPGGWLYLLARPPGERRGRRIRAELDQTARLWLGERVGDALGAVEARGNSSLEALVQPLELDGICLRRDGIREILFRRSRTR